MFIVDRKLRIFLVVPIFFIFLISFISFTSATSNFFGYNKRPIANVNITSNSSSIVINNYYTTNYTNNTYYSSQSGVNSTQLENITVINIKESWLTTFFNSLTSSIYNLFSANDTTLDNRVTSLNTTIANSNASWLSTYNSTYAGFNTTSNLQGILNATYVPYSGAIGSLDMNGFYISNFEKLIFEGWEGDGSTQLQAGAGTWAIDLPSGSGVLALVSDLYDYAPNTTFAIQQLLNSTGIYNQGGGNGTFNESYTNNLYAHNTTFGIQNLLNSTGIYSLPLAINTTFNIQSLLNSTGIYSLPLAINTTFNIQSLLNSTGIYSLPLAINTTANIQGLLNSTGIYSGVTDTNCSGGNCAGIIYWANGSLFNQTDLVLLINTTINIQNLYNSTALQFAQLVNNTATALSINSTLNIQNLLNNTGIYSLPLTINSTLNIQTLLNSTGIYSLPLAINTTANIQGLLNSTGIYNSGGGGLGVNATQMENITLITVKESWLTTFFNSLTSSIYNLFSANDTTLDNRVTSLNTTIANSNASWLSTYNATYAGNLDTNCSSGNCANVFYWTNQSTLNETNLALSINTTANIQGLLNSTGIYNGGSNHTNITFNLWNSTWDNRWILDWLSANDTAVNNSVKMALAINTTAQQALTINSTINIQVLYNSTTLQFAQLVNNTAIALSINSTLNIQNLLNSTGIYSTPLAINTTANIQSLLNSTGIYSLPLAINTTRNIQSLIDNSSIARIGNCTAGQFIQNSTNVGVFCATPPSGNAVYTNLAWTNQSNNFVGWQNFSGVINGSSSIFFRNSVGAINLSAFVDLLTANFTAINATAKLVYGINTTANIQALLNSTGVYSLPLTINNTRNLQVILNGTGVYSTPLTINSTLNIQNLLNGTSINLAWLNVTTFNLTITQGIKVLANKSIYLGLREMYSNDTCVIIKGKVSTLAVC